VHGADVHDDRVGLWMELLRGRTLEQLVASQGPFGAAETAVAGQELCRALAAVHAIGLAHCDVKTANVMRESGGRLVLMDFGAGQRRDLAATGPLELAGTPLYLAPELLRGAGATARSDIYSLGVLLYRLVTGEYPVVATSFDDLRAAHERRDSLRLRDQRPDLPDAFVRVVERALSPDPERRFATAGEMQVALARAVGSEPGDEPTPDPPRWHRGLLWVIAVVGLCVLLGLAIWRPRVAGPSPGGPEHVSLLAVLPFQNLSSDPAEAYLASALPMELTARLGQVGALKVVPWTFMRRFDGAGQETVQEVVRRTGADAIVEGAVQRVPAGDGSAGPVQVRVQIFAASTGTLLWSASFERDLGDFLVVQAQIAREVATRLHVVPAARDETLISRSRQVPPQAMEDYLNARQLLEIQMNLQGAATLFQRAVDRAPFFAEAYVGLAWCRALESAYFGSAPWDVALQRTLAASNRAIQLDPDMPEGWAVRAFARFALEGNWSAAESDFQRALELGPTSADVLQSYSTYLTDRARHIEAIEASRKAEDRAPFSVAASRQVAWAYYMARQYDNAIRQARRTLEIEPGYAPARTVLGRALLLAGRAAEGVSELQAVGRDYEQMLALGYAMAGRREDAMRLLGTILSPTYDRVAASYQVALVYAALGAQSQALDRLEAAYTAKDASITELAVDPMLDPLRDNPRFRALLDKVSSRR
jgi:TolB-like protein